MLWSQGNCWEYHLHMRRVGSKLSAWVLGSITSESCSHIMRIATHSPQGKLFLRHTESSLHLVHTTLHWSTRFPHGV